MNKLLTHIRRSQIEEVAVISPTVRFLIGQYFSDVLRNKRTFTDLHQAFYTEAFDLLVTLEDGQRKFDAVLHDSVLAQQFVALANVIALKQHRRVDVIEVGDQSAVNVVPVLERNLSALAVVRDATERK